MYWVWIIWHCRMLVTFVFHPASCHRCIHSYERWRCKGNEPDTTPRHRGLCYWAGIVSDGFRIRCSGTLSISQENLEVDFVFSPLWLCVGCVFVGCFFLERRPSKVVDGMLVSNMPNETSNGFNVTSIRCIPVPQHCDGRQELIACQR